MKSLIAVILLISTAIMVRAVSVNEGELRFSYDEKTGKKLLSCGNAVIELNAVEVSLEPSAASIPLKRISHAWDEQKRLLRETYESGTLQVTESLKLVNGYAVRSVELLASSSLKKPLQLKKVAFPSKILFSGEYFMIASDQGNGALFDKEMKGRIPASNKDFKLFHQNYSFAPMFLHSDSGVSWFFISDGSLDRCTTGIMAGQGIVQGIQCFNAAGWLEPGLVQYVGTAEIGAMRAGLEVAVSRMPAKWYEVRGFTSPPDRPDWVFDAVMYSCHPLGSLWSGLNDLGGFGPARQELLPVIHNLGFNTIWLLPLEDQWIYWPRDYFKLTKKLEGPEEYRAFLAAAKHSEFRVIQDIVPHGGSPSGGKLRGNSPYTMCFNEKGEVDSYMSFDFGNKEWQQYIGGIATYYMKNYELDGFRIDAVNGNNRLNWKRPGLPAGKPSNVDQKWWDEAAKKADTAELRLDYARASMGMRAAGLQMIDVIRRAVKAQKNSGIVLAETNTPLAISHADVIYDSQFNHITVQKLRELPISAFAAGYMARMEEQQYSDPPGLVRMRCIDNHDTTNLIGLYGLAAWKALYASIFAIPGLPMVYQDKEIFQGPFLRKLIEIRHQLPELRRGNTSYPKVAVSAPEIFSVMREDKDGATLGLINFSPSTITTGLVFPCESGRKFPAKKELMTGLPVTDTITLSPWQTAFVVMRKNSKALPALTPLYEREHILSSNTADDGVMVSEHNDTITVHTAAYNASFSRTDGMLLAMSGRKGELLRKTMFSGDNRSHIKIVPEVTLKDRQLLCRSGNLDWKWIFKPDMIVLEIGQGRNGSSDLDFVIPVADVSRWQAACAEGTIDDFFITRHRHGTPGILPGYRLRGDNTVWEAETMPLSPAEPQIRAGNKNGIAFFSFSEVLAQSPANIRVLDCFNQQNGWFLSLALQEKPLNPVFPAKPSGRISLHISPEEGKIDAVHEKFAPLELPDSIKLSHNSVDWIVKGKFGEVILTRTGGAIRELKDVNGKTLLKNAAIYTDRGFGRKNAERDRSAYANMDTESGMIAVRDDNGLKLTFYGQLRDNGCWKAIEEPIWFVNEYRFPADGSIRCCNAFYAEGSPRVAKGFLAWKGAIPEAQNASFDNGQFDAPKALGKGRVNVSGNKLPALVTVKTSSGNLTFSNIFASGPGIPELFFDNHNMFFAWLNGPVSSFHVKSRYAIEFQLKTTGE